MRCLQSLSRIEIRFTIMKFSIIFHLSLLSLAQFALSEKQYRGCKVFTITSLANETQYNAVIDLQKVRGVDFWSEPSRKRYTDVMVYPDEQNNVEQYLAEYGIDYKVAISDVQGAVDKGKDLRSTRQNSQEMNWKEYQRLSVIHSWLDALAAHNPNIAQIGSIGRTTEGRDMKTIKLSSNLRKNNPIIFIDGGIHAREWISPAVVTYIIGKLMSFEPEDREIMANVDWVFLPVMNADGYEYTHTEDRLWRKSRSIHNGNDCIGVDLNRNFDFHWGENGVKDDPCANTYHGPYPFSEPESNATAKFMLANRNRIRAYITFHSYSQLMLTPYGYTEDLPDDYDQLEALGKRAIKALEEVHGTEYETRTVVPPVILPKEYLRSNTHSL
ncbi:carboxypeptidase B isoform X2 [Folsomia candida]|uniref:carboxypeptidase B isoform X2 n=1 Tax=Folsomia candida TaxID=158441 RepID=UPI001604A718|nr:carboxypeptidase B isoform X2 [Folsomia candida]